MQTKHLLRKSTAVTIILLFIGTVIIPSSGQNIEKTSSSKGNTLYVDESGPDIQFTKYFEIHYGTIADWYPKRCLSVYFINRGDEDIEFWNCGGSGRVLLPFFGPLYGGGTTVLASKHHIHPGGTGFFSCLRLPPLIPWPQLAYVNIYIGTGKGGWYPITDANYINGIFIFWKSLVIPLSVQYSD